MINFKHHLLLWLVMLCGISAFAYDFESGGIYYSINEWDYGNNTVSVTLNEDENIWYTGDIVIPEFVKYNDVEYKVTYIGQYAFAQCEDLTSVTLPISILVIERSAFNNCKGLSTITLPNSVSRIGESAFANCSNLTSIEIPYGVGSILRGAFSKCTSLSSVKIPDSVVNIDEFAFQDCQSLTSVEIPNSVISIGSRAFMGCKALTSLEVPNSVTSIGLSAFNRCSNLTSIKLSNSITSISGSTFSGCSNLTTIIIPDNVESIGESAFSKCSSLTAIELPNKIATIEASTFKECSSLEKVILGERIKDIGQEAFYGCVSAKSIIVEAANPPVCGEQAFDGIDKTTCTLYILESSADAYKNAEPWKDFLCLGQLNIECTLNIKTLDTKVSILFSEEPEITFSEGQIVLTYKDGSNKWAFADFEYWDFDTEYSTSESGINDIVADACDIAISFDGDLIKVNACNQIRVALCNMAGQNLCIAPNSLEIDMSSYPAGVYIVKAGSKIVKFLKK